MASSHHSTPRHERPIPRTNPSGKQVWVARYTNRHGQRKSAGTFKLRREAQAAIDAAYECESSAPSRADTLGGYAKLWPRVHPRTERTNTDNALRVGVVLAMKIDGLELRHWPIQDVRRRHALAVQAELLRPRSVGNFGRVCSVNRLTVR